MPRRRTPPAFQGRGGKWIRVPRPKSVPKAPPQHQPKGDSPKFRVCALCDPAELDSALVTEAQPIISQLFDMGSTEAAGVVMALCDRLAERGMEVSHMKSKKHSGGLLSHLWWKTRHQSRKLKATQQKLDCHRDSRWMRHIHHHNATHGHQHWPP